MAALLGSMRTETVVTFDSDPLVDHRSRRPTQRIVNGVLEAVTTPEIQLRYGVDAGGNDVLLLVGPEPDYRWRAFTDELVELAVGYGVRFVAGLGGFPAPMPHTRPIRIIATAIDEFIANDVGFIPGVREVPAGIHARILKGFEQVGIPAVSLWAMVPHYVSGMPYPAASVGLLEQLGKLSGLAIDTTELRAAADVTRTRIDGLIAQNPEHLAMVDGLERQLDSEGNATTGVGEAPPLDAENLPSGDELAAELQRWLRDKGDS
jgi:proteasome assembly chaperone (PAC2) family protein